MNSIVVVSATSFAQLPNPVASYPFNGNPNDVSGNGNHGILSGSIPTLTTDRFGNPNSAYLFGGYYNPNWIRVNNSSSLQFNKHFSISLWYKQCNVGGMDGWGNYSTYGYNILYGKAGDGYAAAPGIYSGTNLNAAGNITNTFNNKLCYGSAASCYQFSLSAQVPCYDTCEWIHIVHVIDSNIAYQYINGNLMDSSTYNGPANFSVANSQPLYIGKMDGSWYPFNGVIDDINIYNVALNQQQVSTLFGNFSDPYSYSISSSSDTICQGESIILNASGGANYIWTADPSLSNINGSTATATPNQTTTYYVQITNNNGCVGIAQKTIYVEQCSVNCPNGYVLNQDAFGPDANGVFTLTPNSYPKTGNITAVNQYNLNTIFDETFTMNFGCLDANGADGMCIIFHNQGLNYLSWGSNYLGANTNPNQLKIEFDTYANIDAWANGAAWSDPTYDHIAVMKNGSPDHATTNNLFGPVQASSTSVNIEDCNDHNVRVRWNPQYDSLTIYFDGVIRIAGQYDIINNIFNGVPLVYLSVTAGTGGLGNLQTVKSSIFDAPPITHINHSICQGENYNGFTQSGTYTDTFQTSNGCDSIRTLHLTVNPVTYSTISETICQPNSYLGYSTSGTYIDTFINANGCDSIRTLHLTVNPITYSTINQTICQPNTYLGYSTSGTYIDTFVNANGCDSIRTLHLTVNPITYSTINQTICQPNSFLGYSTSGTYIDTLVNANGCDSIRTLHLTVNPITYSTINQTICQPNSYLGYTSSGTYIDTLINAKGCDSIRTLHLTVNPITYSTIHQTICQPNTYLGYSTSGTYIDTLVNANGCDSIRTLHLTVNPITYSTINQTICQPNSYLGYTSSGTYIDTLINAKGCDSIRTLHLTVNPITYSTIHQTICQPNSYLGYSTSGTYIDTFVNANGCDSIRTLHLTVNPITYSTINQTICQPNSFLGYSTSGTYVDTLVNANGCDSIRSLHLTVLPAPINTYDTLESCWTLNYQGQTYSQTTTVIDTILNHLNCDSIYHFMYLNIHSIDTQNVIINKTDCNQVIFEGQSFTSSTTLQDTIVNMHGCDSIYRTINIQITGDDLQTETQALSACESLTFNGVTYTQDTLISQIQSNQYGCDSFELITQINIYYNTELTIDTSICEGEVLSINGINYTTEGFYEQLLSTSNGCDSTINIQLTVTPKPHLSFTWSKINERELCIGEEISLHGEGANNLWWSENGKEIKMKGPDVNIKIYSSLTQVTLYGSNANCEDSIKADITAKNCCNIFLIPNAFTPNNDGINDFYAPILEGWPKRYHLQIFNRYGQKVFQAFNPDLKWDGTFNGKPSDGGTYYYHLDIECSDGSRKVNKGEIILVR